MTSNPIVKATLTVVIFWWCVLTIYEFNGDIFDIYANLDYIFFNFRYVLAAVVCGGIVGIWVILFRRLQAYGRIYQGSGGNAWNGVSSTLGSVPILQPAPKRVSSPSRRVAITQKRILEWLNGPSLDHPHHRALFLAILDTYSAHRNLPASHRRGGHGSRRLWEHCLAVSETCLRDAQAWKYQGLYSNFKGKQPFLILGKKNPEFEFDASDPLIPIIGLAHDIGKLETYSFDAEGSLISREETSGDTPGDRKVFHDALGARILARIPEYWALTQRDRNVLNLAIAHYHHPADIPVDGNGQAIDDRTMALMAFLIQCDRLTGYEEAGLVNGSTADILSEEESEAIYNAFVEIVTTFGRINGDRSKDPSFKIGQKHDGLIVIKELELRKLLLAKLDKSMEAGDSKYRVTRDLILTLSSKGLLYNRHNGIDFGRYYPMFTVSFWEQSDAARYLASWQTTIIITPNSKKAPELGSLVDLPNSASKMVFDRPVYTHNDAIDNPAALRALVERAFGDEVARSISIAGRTETKKGTALRHSASHDGPTSVPLGDIQEPPQPDANSLLLVPGSQSVAELPVENDDSSQAPSTFAVSAESRDNESVAMAEELADGFEELPDIDDPEFDDDADVLGSTAQVGSPQGEEEEEMDLDEANLSSAPLTPDVPPAGIALEPSISLIERSGQATLPGIAVPDGRPIKQRTKRDIERDQANLASLDNAKKILEVYAAKPANTRKQRAKKAVSDDHLSRIRDIQALIEKGELEVCGTKDGYNYVLTADVGLLDSTLNVYALIQAAKLPTLEADERTSMVGIPIKAERS